MKIEVYGTTKKGRAHKVNEDAFLIDEGKGLFAVADGVTLPSGGKEAADLAIRYLKKVFDGDLEKAFSKVNSKMLKDKEKNNKIGSSTLVAVYFKGGKEVDFVSVGDSVAFLISRRAEMIFTPILESVIGTPSLKTDFKTGKVSAGDYILLCSDGITDVLSKAEIATFVKTEDTLEQNVKRLFALAGRKKTTYKDDKTVVLIKVVKNG